MFVGPQDWTVPTYAQIENNKSVGFAANCILTVDHRYRAFGTAHLMPTTGPYLVQSLWPILFNREPPDCDALCTAFRCSCDRELGTASRPGVIIQLFLKCQEFPIAHDIQSVPGAREADLSKMLLPQTLALPLQWSRRCKGMDRRLPPLYVTSFGGGPPSHRSGSYANAGSRQCRPAETLRSNSACYA